MDVGHPLRPELRLDFRFSHEAELRREDGALGGVAVGMESDGDGFSTKCGGAEEGFGVDSGLGFNDQGSVGRGFNVGIG